MATTKQFRLANGTVISVTTNEGILRQGQTWIMISKFREVDQMQMSVNPFSFGQPLPNLYLEDGFWSELQSQLNIISRNSQTTKISQRNIFDSCFYLVKNHIKEYGRIIDIDLISYIDISLYIIEAIDDKTKSISDYKKIWTELFNELKDAFGKDIYFNSVLGQLTKYKN